MQNISMSDAELLKFAIENGMLDTALVQEKIEMRKREEILLNHNYSVWFSEKEGVWYTHLPDETKKNKRTKVKRKKRKDLDNVIVEYYMSLKLEEMEEKTEEKKNLFLEELFYEFMEYKTKTVDSGTVKRMMADWKRFYSPKTEFIKKQIEELTKIDIDDFFNTVLDEHKLKKKAFYNMCGILKQMLEYAVDAEYLEKNPYRTKINKKKLVSEKKSNAKEVYKTDEKKLFIEEMERRLRNNPSNTAPLAVLLDFEIGTRKGEILAISKSDIVGNKIHIHRQLVEEFDVSDLNNIQSKGWQVVEYTKSEDGDRWLPLTTKAKRIIERVQEVNKEYGYGYEDFLFVRDGKYMSPDMIDAQVKRGCEYIGIPVKTMHKIRKTYASTLLHNGVNISIVKDMLGHADESTTLKHYIYNVEDNVETENIVLNALEGEKRVKSDQSDQKIILFSRNKKVENLGKSRVSTI